MPARFERFIGVDFSGAVDAGDRIWVAIAAEHNGTLLIERLVPAAALAGSGRSRAAALPALQDFLAGQDRALIGLDFPFSLPGALIDEPDWVSFAAGFEARFPNAETFRAWCQARAGGREIKRRADIESRTPFGAYNLRLYRQTWWGLAVLVAPLLRRDRADVPPMLVRGTDRPTLLEICPASTLKRLGCYGSYKGRGPLPAALRTGIVDRLTQDGLLLPEPWRATCLSNWGGDALDGVIAAFACWRTAATPDLLEPRDAVDRIEGRVYF